MIMYVYIYIYIYMVLLMEILLIILQDPLTRAKKAVHRLVERVGFFGILLCASVSCKMFDIY